MVEDVFDLVWWDFCFGIGYFDQGCVCYYGGFQVDDVLWWCIVDGIGDQVVYCMMQQGGIGVQDVVVGYCDVYLCFFGDVFEIVGDVVEFFGYVQWLDL